MINIFDFNSQAKASLAKLAPTVQTEIGNTLDASPLTNEFLELLLSLKYSIDDKKTYLLLISTLNGKQKKIARAQAGLNYLNDNTTKPNLFAFLTFLNLCAELGMSGIHIYLTCSTLFSEPKKYPLDKVNAFFSDVRKKSKELKSKACFTDKLITCMHLVDTVDTATQQSFPLELILLMSSYILGNGNYQETNLQTLKESEYGAVSFKR